MTLRRTLSVGALLAFLAGCGTGDAPGGEPLEGSAGSGDDLIRVDSVAATLPGVVLRFGPAEPAVATGPVYPPVVVGDEGQVSIYEGFLIRQPCALPLRADARIRADTIQVRLISEIDAARSPCAGEPTPTAYAVLVGPFEPGSYALRLAHEGDLARETPLDTIYTNVTVRPHSR